jgi:DNA repair protein RecO (recombination protein O)
MSLIRLLTAESQSNIKIFNLIEKFYLILSNDDWLKDYIFWELELLKTIGFDLELSNFATKEFLDDKIIYVVKSKNEKKIIPNFLIDKKIVVNDLNILLNGLKLVSDFLEKTILKPNNLNYPISRTQFINSLR